MTPGLNLPLVAPALISEGSPPKPDDPAKVRDAAQQFEALLLSQILRSVRESSGWGGPTQQGSARRILPSNNLRVFWRSRVGLGWRL